MANKIIIIEDNKFWHNHLYSLINENFNVEIIRFFSFVEAENYLLKNSDFNIMVTDIFPARSKDPLGLKLAKFVSEIRNISVVVVTAEYSYVTSTIREYNVVEVYYKQKFDKIGFLNVINSLLISCGLPHGNNAPIDNVPFTLSPKIPFSIVQTDFGKKGDSKLARILVSQIESSLDKWREQKSLFYPNDIEWFKEKIFTILNKSIEKNVAAVVFPELTVPEILIPDLINWSEIHKDIIIIGGSHYHARERRTISKCPIIVNGRVYYTEKVYPSPNELSPIAGNGLDHGSMIYCFKNSIIGDFFVLICADNLKSIEIRNECLKHLPDFIIVLACQLDSSDYYTGMSDTVNNGADMFYIYSNNKINKVADGNSAFFGIVRREIRDELIRNNVTDFIPKGKICQLKGAEDYYVIDVDINNKNPSGKRKVGDIPNVKVEVGSMFI